jgi:hypothetical protein
VAEDDSSLVAASALDVHEVTVGSRHQALEFVTLLLGLQGRVQQVAVHQLLRISKYFITHMTRII